MEIQDFFNEVYGELENTDYFYIWNKRTKQTFWTNSIDEAVKFAEKKKSVTGNELYISVGTGNNPYLNKRIMGDAKKGPEYKQFLEEEVTKLTGFYLDIDVETGTEDVHKKTSLPKTQKEALSLLENVWPQPTFIINSGYGFHCWWLFREPYEIETQQERADIKLMLRQFNGYFVKRAKELGFEIDHLYDLKRLLRIPDTKNYKNKKYPKSVKLHSYNGAKYNPEDFEYLLLPEEKLSDISPVKSKESGVNVKVGNKDIQKILDELDFSDPEISKDKLMMLQVTFDPVFTQIWEKKMDDDPNFSSGSEYDWRLISYGKRIKFSNQEMLQLMLSFRSKHGLDLKFDNKQYYARTIHTMNESFDEEKAGVKEATKTNSDNQSNTENLQEKNNLSEEDKSNTLESLSYNLKFQIDKIVKYQEDPRSQFVLKSGDQTIFLGDISQITSINNFRNRILEAKHHCIPGYKNKEWFRIVQKMFDVCEEIRTSEENTDKAVVLWIQEYLEDCPEVDLDEGCQTNSSFYHDGNWYLFLDKFYTWCQSSKNTDIKKNRFITLLRMHGCENVRITYTKDEETGEKGRKRVWLIPSKII
ncbi:MAG: hypothetical protein ACQESF_02625 [Nanobdellota archaeon]